MNSFEKYDASHRPGFPAGSPVLRPTNRIEINSSVGYLFLLAIVISLAFSGCSPPKTEPAEEVSGTALSEFITLKIVTFNVWDSYFFPDHKRRMLEIGKFLAKHDPDLVGLQEAFIEKDRRLLLDQLEDSRLKYSEYFPSGTMGSGLMIISAFPFRKTAFHKYSANGKWYKPWQGDWYAGKGVAHARIELPDESGYLDFYNTHAVAGYPDQNDLHAEHRIIQMKELAAFLKKSTADAFPALLVGDINCSIGSEEYRTATERAGLTRLLNIDSDIDHIFGVQNTDYRFTINESGKFSHFTSEEGEERRMSDHDCYISTVRIEPAQQ